MQALIRVAWVRQCHLPISCLKGCLLEVGATQVSYAEPHKGRCAKTCLCTQSRVCLLSTMQPMMGKDFGGDAFITTPAVVEFKDFDVGQTYMSRVIITNRSYAKNTFRVLEVRLKGRLLNRATSSLR